MSHFYAMLSRMKYINRWGLMRNTQKESICEHSLEVAILAHALAVIHNRRFHGNVNPERAATLAIFHDAPEIITGDLPTPVKYYNPSIHKAYQEVEKVAQEKLLSMLPQDLKQDYTSLLFQEQEERKRGKDLGRTGGAGSESRQYRISDLFFRESRRSPTAGRTDHRRASSA